MAPRRHGSGHGGGLLESSVFQQQHLTSSSNHPLDLDLSHVFGGASLRCCTPGECLRSDIPVRAWSFQESVRVVCNNESCTAGQFMHRECFESWEQTILAYLKTCGRARNWSDRQRHQNLWTKKGYDLAYKACGCKCLRGNLKKDLDWASTMGQLQPASTENTGEAKKKKNRRNRQNAKSSPTASSGPNTQQMINTQHQHILGAVDTRGRAGSLSSSTGSSSPPATASETSVSPLHQPMFKRKTKLEVGCGIRQSCGANGIFSRRQDFSAFNSLPRSKLNSYHIKMEDEGNHGNDDTRSFILSTLAALQWPRVSCVLCRSAMLVFDRYPLVDGTFFLSPRKYTDTCAEVKVDNRTQYLSAVCMSCLEGSNPVYCQFCNVPWDGSSLILGTMYSYDIFAAMPCCINRLKCNVCHNPLIHPPQRLNFFSDYSRVFACQNCGTADTHFVMPLTQCFKTSCESHFHQYSPWP